MAVPGPVTSERNEKNERECSTAGEANMGVSVGGGLSQQPMKSLSEASGGSMQRAN